MEKITRSESPGWLKEKWQEWGKDWAVKYAKTKKSSSFSWRQHKGNSSKQLVDELAAMTLHHCSFCDAYPMGRMLKSTIEHFKPKTRFPLEAYKWENLFLCCVICQEKGYKYDERLLKPDADTYTFDNYFDINWENGDLFPNVAASPEDQERARITIEFYKLNKNGKSKSRKDMFEIYMQLQHPDIDKFPYRFFLKAAPSLPKSVFRKTGD